MTDAVTALAADYGESTTITTGFGASSTLAKQIHDGAPAGVYISASREWVDYLKKREHVDGEPVVIARNTLVLVVGADSDLKWGGPAQLGNSPPAVIAIADEGVPAGDYARQALTRLSLMDVLKDRLVAQKDVRAVVQAVISGNAEAGFVYATDAVAFKDRLRVDFQVESALHEPIEYFAALLTGAEDPEAARGFFKYLQTERAQAQLLELGFSEP
jgi:molybdate transport system substrate-binding protein